MERKIALMGLCILQIRNKNIRKKKRKWVKKWLSEREKYGHMALVRELRQNQHDDLKNYLRMSGPIFDELLGKLQYILKGWTTFEWQIFVDTFNNDFIVF